jgi:hypothetical protein
LADGYDESVTRDFLASRVVQSCCRPGVIVLDLAWKGLWLFGTGVLSAVLSVWVYRQLATIEVSGPPGAFRNPVALMLLARELWEAYAVSLAALLGVLLAASLGLWVVLESYFRAGIFAAGPPSFFQRAARSFWRFLLMGCLKLLAIGSAAAILAIIVFRHYLRTPPADWHLLWIDSRGGLFASFVILAALWLGLGIFEVLARRDAVYLLGPHLFLLAGVFAALWLFELAVIGAAVAVAVLLAATLPASAAAVFLVVCGGGLMGIAVLHSCVMTARFAFIDVLRAGSFHLRDVESAEQGDHFRVGDVRV